MNHADLWTRCAQGDEAARSALLDHHLSLVHHVARALARALAVGVEVDDLVSAGTIGLLRAVETFDATRGAAFSTFAVPRIRGAMLDELRRVDHVPRSVRAKRRRISTARRACESSEGRAPTPRQLASALDVDLETLHGWQLDVACAATLPLEQTIAREHGQPRTAGDLVADETDEPAESRLTRAQELVILRDRIRQLTTQEQVVIALYYFEELTQREIAEFMGITSSRVSQIQSRVLEKLRRELRFLRDAAA